MLNRRLARVYGTDNNANPPPALPANPVAQASPVVSPSKAKRARRVSRLNAIDELVSSEDELESDKSNVGNGFDDAGTSSSLSVGIGANDNSSGAVSIDAKNLERDNSENALAIVPLPVETETRDSSGEVRHETVESVHMKNVDQTQLLAQENDDEMDYGIMDNDERQQILVSFELTQVNHVS